jgi:hypothetical protein
MLPAHNFINWADWSSGNALNSYSGGAWFESPQKHQVFWSRFYVVFLNPSCKTPGLYLDQATKVALQILSSSSFICHSTIRCLWSSYRQQRNATSLHTDFVLKSDSYRATYGNRKELKWISTHYQESHVGTWTADQNNIGNGTGIPTARDQQIPSSAHLYQMKNQGRLIKNQEQRVNIQGWGVKKSGPIN